MCVDFFNYKFVNGISELYVNEVIYNTHTHTTKFWEGRGAKVAQGIFVIFVMNLFIGNSIGFTCYLWLQIAGGIFILGPKSGGVSYRSADMHIKCQMGQSPTDREKSRRRN